MGNLKNLLFVAVFMLFGLGVQANTPQYTTPVYDLSFNALPNGIIHIIQGRYEVRVEILVEDTVELVLLNSSGKVVFEEIVGRQKRVVNINTNGYASGVYTLVVESLLGKEEIKFVVN